MDRISAEIKKLQKRTIQKSKTKNAEKVFLVSKHPLACRTGRLKMTEGYESLKTDQKKVSHLKEREIRI